MNKYVIVKLGSIRCFSLFLSFFSASAVLAEKRTEVFPVETRSILWKISSDSPESVINSFLNLFSNGRYMDAFYAFDPSTRRVMASQVLSGSFSNWVRGNEAAARVRPYLLSNDINLMDTAILFDQLMGLSNERGGFVTDIKNLRISRDNKVSDGGGFSKVTLREGWSCIVRRNEWLGWRIVGFFKEHKEEWPVLFTDIPDLDRGKDFPSD